MKRQRLSPESWIEAGLASLVSEGPNALAAEPLARKISASKGSFYWHFKDVPDFQSAVVRYWQNAAFADVVAALEGKGTAEQRLRSFGKTVLANAQDPAMRAWARSDKKVAKAIAQVDAERLKYLNNLLSHMGIANDDFARSSLAALVGLPAVANKSQALKAYDSMMDMVLALQLT
ncbi:MAG: TetR/AcrR family transcriptional regulator [Roseobacter sp.]